MQEMYFNHTERTQSVFQTTQSRHVRKRGSELKLGQKTEGSQSYPCDIGFKQFKQQFLELQRTCYLLAES